MSVKRFIEDKDVTAKLSSIFKKPKIECSREMLAEPKSENFGEVGTAFDYLMRFYIEYLNPSIDFKGELVANGVLQYMKRIKHKDLKVAEDIMESANKVTNKYISTGKLSVELVIAVLQMAQMDTVYRAGYYKGNLGQVNSKDIEDIINLYEILDDSIWMSMGPPIYLNPTFGKASQLVSGADADLYVGDIILDFKVTKSPGITRQVFNQLICYYTLFRLQGYAIGLENCGRDLITRLGIYSARFGELILFDISATMDEEKFLEFASWFVDKAGELYNHNADLLNNFKK